MIEIFSYQYLSLLPIILAHHILKGINTNVAKSLLFNLETMVVIKKI
jgi:hypothetical protein